MSNQRKRYAIIGIGSQEKMFIDATVSTYQGPHKQTVSHIDGATSILLGVAANHSIASSKMIYSK